MEEEIQITGCMSNEKVKESELRLSFVREVTKQVRETSN